MMSDYAKSITLTMNHQYANMLKVKLGFHTKGIVPAVDACIRNHRQHKDTDVKTNYDSIVDKVEANRERLVNTARYLRSNLGLLLLESEVLLDEVCPDDSSDLRLQDHDHKQHDHTNEHKLMQDQENKLTMNSQ